MSDSCIEETEQILILLAIKNKEKVECSHRSDRAIRLVLAPVSVNIIVQLHDKSASNSQLLTLTISYYQPF